MHSCLRLFLITFLALTLFLPLTNSLSAQTEEAFTGKVNANGINIRSDSTVNSEVICSVNKGQNLKVVSGLYEWYKIRLPESAPSFINKKLVAVIKEDKTPDARVAKVTKNRVNIRLRPSKSSPILGQANKDDVIDILKDDGKWFKIKPVNNSFGWINKKFLEVAD